MSETGFGVGGPAYWNTMDMNAKFKIFTDASWLNFISLSYTNFSSLFLIKKVAWVFSLTFVDEVNWPPRSPYLSAVVRYGPCKFCHEIPGLSSVAVWSRAASDRDFFWTAWVLSHFFDVLSRDADLEATTTYCIFLCVIKVVDETEPPLET